MKRIQIFILVFFIALISIYCFNIDQKIIIDLIHTILNLLHGGI